MWEQQHQQGTYICFCATNTDIILFEAANQPRLCLCLHVLDLFPFLRRFRLFLHRTFLVVEDTVIAVAAVSGVDDVGVVAAVASGAVIVVGDGGDGGDGVAVDGAAAVIAVDDGVFVVAFIIVSAVVAGVEILLVDSFGAGVRTVRAPLLLSTIFFIFFTHGLLGSEHSVLPNLVWNLQQVIVTLILLFYFYEYN